MDSSNGWIKWICGNLEQKRLSHFRANKSRTKTNADFTVAFLMISLHTLNIRESFHNFHPLRHTFLMTKWSRRCKAKFLNNNSLLIVENAMWKSEVVLFCFIFYPFALGEFYIVDFFYPAELNNNHVCKRYNMTKHICNLLSAKIDKIIFSQLVLFPFTDFLIFRLFLQSYQCSIIHSCDWYWPICQSGEDKRR